MVESKDAHYYINTTASDDRIPKRALTTAYNQKQEKGEYYTIYIGSRRLRTSCDAEKFQREPLGSLEMGRL